MKTVACFSALIWLAALANGDPAYDIHQNAITEEDFALELVDGNTTEGIGTIVDGSVIGVNASYESTTPSLNVHAIFASGHSVKSVVFGYGDNRTFHVDNNIPFALYGHQDGRCHQCSLLGYGTHTVIVTPYSEYDAKGEPGKSVTVTFSIFQEAQSALSHARGLVTSTRRCGVPQVNSFRVFL
jgi:hypothetical protein